MEGRRGITLGAAYPTGSLSHPSDRAPSQHTAHLGGDSPPDGEQSLGPGTLRDGPARTRLVSADSLNQARNLRQPVDIPYLLFQSPTAPVRTLEVPPAPESSGWWAVKALNLCLNFSKSVNFPGNLNLSLSAPNTIFF